MRVNERTDERVVQYSNLYSWLFWPTDGVGAAEFVGKGAKIDGAQHDARPHAALGRRHQGMGGADEVPLATGAAVDDLGGGKRGWVRRWFLHYGTIRTDNVPFTADTAVDDCEEMWER